MRNLKKILAVLCVVAMMASIAIVPALAAGFTYETQATTLNTLGVMAGMNLGDEVTRIQGLTFAIKAAGKDAAAQALTQAEVDAALANVVDAADIPAWGQKYAAYAVINGMTTGTDASIAPKVKFSPLQAVSGDSFLVWTLKSMGYTTVGTADAWEVAVTDAKVLTLSQGYSIHGAAKLIRDDVAGVLYGALDNGVCKDGKAFVDTLIAAGMFTQQAAADAGLTTPPAPAAIGVSSVTALNLNQIKVVFNMAVDKTTAEDESNYTLNNGTQNTTLNTVATWTGTPAADLQSDPTTVIITLDTDSDGAADPALSNQITNKLTIKNVKQADKAATVATGTFDIVYTDTQIPAAQSVTVVGNSQIKVVFSEPVRDNLAEAASAYKLNGSPITAYNNGTLAYDEKSFTVTIPFNTALPDGAYTLKVSQDNSIVDFAGWKVLATELPFTIAKDATEGVVKSATVNSGKTNIVIEFTKPISSITNTAAAGPVTVDGIDVCNDATITATVDSNKIKLVAAGAGTSFNALVASGDHVVRSVKNDTDFLTDTYGVKIKDGTTVSYNVAADATKPTVSKVEVKNSGATFEVTFSEAVDSTTAQMVSNYSFKDSTGAVKDITSALFKAGYSDIIVLTPKDVPAAGTYTLTVKNVKDTASNVIDESANTIVVTDTTGPLVSGQPTFTGTKITVLFNEAMDPTTISNVANFLYKNAALPSGTTVSVTNSNKSVVLELPAGTTITAGDAFAVSSACKDTSGNALQGFGFTTTVAAATNNMDSVDFDATTAAKATGTDTIQFQLNKELSVLDVSDFEVDTDHDGVFNEATDDGVPVQSGSSFTNSDGKATVTVKLTATKIPVDVTTASLIRVKNIAAASTKAVDGTTFATAQGGAKINAAGGIGLSDKIAPALVDTANNPIVTYDADGNGKIDHIILTYKEAMDKNYVSPLTYTVDGYTVNGAKTDDTATLAALKLSLGAANTPGNGNNGKFVVLVVGEKSYNDGNVLPAVTQALTIKDANGNSLAAQTAVASKDNAEAALLSAEVYTAAGAKKAAAGAAVVGDYILLTFSEPITVTVDTDGTSGTSIDGQVGVARIDTEDLTVKVGVAAAGDTALAVGTTGTVTSVDSTHLKITIVALAGGESIANGAAAAISDDTVTLKAGTLVDAQGNVNVAQVVTIK